MAGEMRTLPSDKAAIASLCSNANEKYQDNNLRRNSSAGNMVDASDWSGQEKLQFNELRWCDNERDREKAGVLKIDGNTTSALAGIILAEVECHLRVAVTGKQAAEQCLANFVPLAL